MSYHGRFTPKNPHKYRGDHNDIVYRSSWERAVFKWCDSQPEIIGWSSEEIVVPYRCQTDKEMHRYFVDLFIQFANGKTLLVEIKPQKQVTPPEKQKRVTRRYLGEVLTYAKNVSKWKAAEQYALDRGWAFEVWTENQLKALGLKVL